MSDQQKGIAGPIQNCKLTYNCPERWDGLSRIDGQEAKRFCSSCEKVVYLVQTDKQIADALRERKCVCIADEHRQPTGHVGW